MGELTLDTVRTKYELLRPLMDERMRRQWAASEALSLKRGGVTVVAKATGLSRTTIGQGMRELRERDNLGIEDESCVWELPARVRRPGGGRHPLKMNDPTLVADLHALIEPTTRGDPQSPLRWTCKSTRNLADELTAQGHPVSAKTVARLLAGMDYSLQAPSKQVEGAQHPDRDGQFHYLNEQAKVHLAAGQPVISVDTKKKEVVGNLANKGREWQPKGDPVRVDVHDFPDPKVGKAIPYGVYDLGADAGWVSVGDDHDTAAFAVATIRRWWDMVGSQAYPQATRLLITADAGGSNGYRSRLWKVELGKLAAETGLAVTVCHLPPGTSKWNRIEHRLFSHISM